MSIVLRGTARTVLTLLERYGCIKGNEAEGPPLADRGHYDNRCRAEGPAP